MELNYYALVVAILGNCIPEKAFEKLQSGHPDFVKNHFTDEDIDDMVCFRNQGLTYKDIGEIYCIDYTTIYKWLERRGKLVKAIIGGAYEARENPNQSPKAENQIPWA